MKILLAEDCLILGAFFEHCLKWQGHDVLVVHDGRELLDELAVGNYDLVITDHNMPRVTGVEALKQIRKTDGHTPVIVLTGVEGDDALKLEQDVRTLGGGFLSKSGAPANLLAAMDNLHARAP